jgi:tetratricopeptide (TPR) repeat protein
MKEAMKKWFFSAILLAVLMPAFSQDHTGTEAVAERYSRYVQSLLDGGQLEQAEAALLRALDYADVSSDISYQLAFARQGLGRPVYLALEAVRDALDTDRFRVYRAEDARLIEARCLLMLRQYSTVLRTVQLCADNADSALVRLEAWKGLDDRPAFIREAGLSLDRFAREPRISALILRYAATHTPAGNEQALVDRVLRILPVLTDHNPELAYLAAPFVYDWQEARRLVAAYRAVTPVPAAESLPVSLDLGVIGGESATAALFAFDTIDRDIVLAVWSLLGTDETRDAFEQRLRVFSGFITIDENHDGITETRAEYHEGRLVSYNHDADQDGVSDISVDFAGDLPESGFLAAGNITLSWQDFPSIRYAEKDGLRYDFAPRSLFFSPFRLHELCGVIMFPEPDRYADMTTERTLAGFALAITRDSREFDGVQEVITMLDGIPLRAEERLGGRLVSETEFDRGFPVQQLIDLDLNGTLETVRRFRTARVSIYYPFHEVSFSSQVSDFNDNGVAEYKEEYAADGTVSRFWDMVEDGVYEYSE